MPPKEHECKSKHYEPGWHHSIWKHPIVLFFLLNIVLVLFLIFMGWLALEQGWIPERV